MAVAIGAHIASAGDDQVGMGGVNCFEVRSARVRKTGDVRQLVGEISRRFSDGPHRIDGEHRLDAEGHEPVVGRGAQARDAQRTAGNARFTKRVLDEAVVVRFLEERHRPRLRRLSAGAAALGFDGDLAGAHQGPGHDRCGEDGGNGELHGGGYSQGV